MLSLSLKRVASKREAYRSLIVPSTVKLAIFIPNRYYFWRSLSHPLLVFLRLSALEDMACKPHHLNCSLLVYTIQYDLCVHNIICLCPVELEYRLFPRDVISVQEFFACMDPNNDLKPILSLGDINVEEGTPCLALVVDKSGSMEKEIKAAKRIIRSFVASEENEPGCYVLVPFVDPTGEEKSKQYL